MTLRQLEYFLKIAETGNITKASQQLNVSQPPLSLQLKALEDELGVQLFDREKKSLSITPKGKQLQENVKKIIALVNDTIYEMQSTNIMARNVIRIGSIASSSNRVLPGMIKEFNVKYPYVDFEIFEENTLTTIQYLAEGIVDLGIIREPFNRTLFRCIPIKDKDLGEDQNDCFVCIAHPKFYDDLLGDTLPFTAIKNKPIILHRRHMDLIVNACRQKGFAPHIICQNGDISSSISWAQEGLGIAIAPYTSALLNKDPGVLIKRLVDPMISCRVNLVWTRNMVPSKELKAFIHMAEHNC